ncbi:MAG: glycine zipper 2TM domain-containing protein [Usitatibacter sp.]
MKKLAIAMASIIAVAAPLAHAAYDRNGNYYEPYQPGVYEGRPMSRAERQDYARVIDSRPVYANSGSREECWNPRAGHYEERRDTGHHDNVNGGTVAGAVVGGVVGHQLDNGSAGATIGGALLGGLIGNKVNKDRSEDRQDDLDYSRCRVIAEGGSGQLLGYDVRYDYQGREYVARMDHQPPRRLVVGRDIRDDGQPF